jgi:hypothetical protein
VTPSRQSDRELRSHIGAMSVAATIFIALAAAMLLAGFFKLEAADYNRACRDHSGIRQIAPASAPLTPPRIVVCNDGRAIGP